VSLVWGDGHGRQSHTFLLVISSILFPARVAIPDPLHAILEAEKNVHQTRSF
jgi:hypothetical protein